jgi:hypothetical protein
METNSHTCKICYKLEMFLFHEDEATTYANPEIKNIFWGDKPQTLAAERSNTRTNSKKKFSSSHRIANRGEP